jgi:hypothetical protein
VTSNYQSESSVVLEDRNILQATKELKLNYANESNGRRNPTSTRHIDLSGWIGTPLETWARAWIQALQYIIRRGDTEISTCVKLGTIHGVFFTFLQLPQIAVTPYAPNELEPRHMTLFRQWLKATQSRNTAHADGQDHGQVRASEHLVYARHSVARCPSVRHRPVDQEQSAQSPAAERSGTASPKRDRRRLASTTFRN